MYSDRDGTATKQSQSTYDTHLRFLRLASSVLSSIGFGAVATGGEYSCTPSQWLIDCIWRCNWHHAASFLWVGLPGGAQLIKSHLDYIRLLTIALFIAHSLFSQPCFVYEGRSYIYVSICSSRHTDVVAADLLSTADPVDRRRRQ